MKKILVPCLLTLLLVSCLKVPNDPVTDYIFGGGIYVVNEGVFNSGNGSLSFWSYDSTEMYNDLFAKVNGRPLGDVPNSIFIYQDNAYVIVNNSGKIEVIDPATTESKATVTGLNSPRNMAIVSSTRAYITSLYSNSIAILNLTTNTISGYVDVKHSTEAISVLGSRAFVSSWLGGNKIFVINTLNDKVIDSIEVGAEPETMVVDRNLKLWVLCTGGWRKEHYAELDLVNPGTHLVENRYVFPNIEDSPSCLTIDGLGQNLVFLDKGVKMMNITSGSLPTQPLIPSDGANFYKVAVNPLNSDIFVTDAGDYLNSGSLSLYKNNGVFVSRHEAGITPGSMFFLLDIRTE